MRFIIRVLILFFVISAVLSVIRGVFSVRSVSQSRPNRLVKDPVCGTYVAEGSAIQSGEHFFCSNECRTRYLAG